MERETRIRILRALTVLVSALAVLVTQRPANAQAKEQFVPAMFYWVGPYAAGGSG